MSNSQQSPPLPIRRLSAVWFADIVGFSSITSVNETLGLRHVELLQRIARRETEEHYKGRIVKFIGDAALAEFGSADAAVRSALAVSSFYTEEARELGRDSTLRIGVHLGEVILADDGDIYGDGVNVASRLQSEAEPGRVLISEDVWRQLRQRPEFMFHSLGQKELKGISNRMGVYDVLVRGTGDSADALHPRTQMHRSPFGKRKHRKAAGVIAGISAALLAAVLLWPKTTHDDTVALAEWTSAGGENQERVERFTRGLTNELRIAIRAAGLSNITQEHPSRYQINGDVRATDDSVRVIVDLMDSKEDLNLYSWTFNRALTDRFDVHRDLAQEINTAVAQQLHKAELVTPAPVPAPVVEKKVEPPAQVQPKKEPPVARPPSPAVAARTAVNTFARALANGSAPQRYAFTSTVLKEIHAFTGDKSAITDVGVSGFKILNSDPDRVQADLLLVVTQRSGTDVESIPLPFRATVTRAGDTWNVTGMRRR